MARFLFRRQEPQKSVDRPPPHSTIEAPKLLASAQSAISEGRIGDAEKLCREAIALQPGSTGALLLLGTIEARTGRLAQGTQTLRTLLEYEYDCFEALNWLAAMLREGNECEEAAALCKRALELRPEDAETWNNLGLSHFGWAHFAQAASAFKHAARLCPANPVYWCNFGAALERQEKYREAEAAYRDGLARLPSNVQLRAKLGQVLLSRGAAEEAVVVCRRALELEPGSAARNLQLAQALAASEHLADAESHVRTALALDPNLPLAHGVLGVILQRYGKFEEANIHLVRAMELEPAEVSHCYEWVRRNKLGDQDRPLVERMEGMLDEGGRRWDDRRLLRYALGKAYDDLGEYERAIGHFDEANRIMADRLLSERPFNERRYASTTDRQINAFSAAFMARNRDWGSSSEVPVLIVGMMRSGTTLVEQIISSHPQVAAGGELAFWPQHAIADFDPTDTGRNESKGQPVIAEYLELLRSISRDAPRVTDKLPQNFMHLGPIHLLFPKARIIHCRRNPVDNCLSIYTTPFRDSPEYGHVRHNIAFAYREYVRIMEHWRKTLSPGAMMEIDYEGLVSDHEGSARKLVSFCGLPWDDACLKHETNDRAIHTASVWQARQPIYKTSVERWRRYEPWLGEFRSLMEPGAEREAA